jgi:hypothetical protein
VLPQFCANLHQDPAQAIQPAAITAIAPVTVFRGVFDQRRITGQEQNPSESVF